MSLEIMIHKRFNQEELLIRATEDEPAYAFLVTSYLDDTYQLFGRLYKQIEPTIFQEWFDQPQGIWKFWRVIGDLTNVLPIPLFEVEDE